MSTLFTTATTFETVTCSCGGVYALPQSYMTSQRASAGSWHCPYCEGVVGFFESDADKLRKMLDGAERRRAAAEQRAAVAEDSAQVARRRRAAAQGQVTKIKRRIAAGKCPSCRTQFADLAAHMSERHPEFAEATT